MQIRCTVDYMYFSVEKYMHLHQWFPVARTAPLPADIQLYDIFRACVSGDLIQFWYPILFVEYLLKFKYKSLGRRQSEEI